MSNNPPISQVGLSDDGNTTFLIRWRGRQEGPYTAAIIEAKLAANQIGLLHEIAHNGQWVTLREFFAEREAVIRSENQAREEAERKNREDAERQAKDREAQRQEENLAEERRRTLQAEAERFRQQQSVSPPAQPSPPDKGSSRLRIWGLLFLLVGIVTAGYFFFGFDPSVESGMGRVNNLGLMADRQNGIIVGIGLGVVGAIMLAIGARGKN